MMPTEKAVFQDLETGAKFQGMLWVERTPEDSDESFKERREGALLAAKLTAIKRGLVFVGVEKIRWTVGGNQ